MDSVPKQNNNSTAENCKSKINYLRSLEIALGHRAIGELAPRCNPPNFLRTASLCGFSTTSYFLNSLFLLPCSPVLCYRNWTQRLSRRKWVGLFSKCWVWGCHFPWKRQAINSVAYSQHPPVEELSLLYGLKTEEPFARILVQNQRAGSFVRRTT